MIPFTEWIKVNKFPTEFNFRKIYTANQDKFFISTVDSNRKNVSFDMTMNTDGKWNIMNPAPEFILLLKERLITILTSHCGTQPIPLWVKA